MLCSEALASGASKLMLFYDWEAGETFLVHINSEENPIVPHVGMKKIIFKGKCKKEYMLKNVFLRQFQKKESTILACVKK